MTDLSLNILLTGQDVSASAVMNAVGGAIQNLASGNVLGAVGLAAAAAGTALIGIGTQATQMAAQYQQSQNMVQALTGASASEMATYDSQLKQLAVDAGVAPTALSQGLYNVLSAGYKAGDAMKVLTLATEDSKIGMTDATTTTNMLTTVLRSFGISASDATRVNGEMLATVTAGRSTFQQYATNIGNAASVSAQFHVSLETMNAAWATETANGFNAAQATVDYDQAVRVMYGNIGTVTKSLEKNGIAFNEAKFNAMSFGDKVVYLNSALQKANAEHVKVTGATMQASAAIQKISQNISMYNDDLANFSNRAKMAQQTQQAWAITQAGFNQQLSRLQAAFQVLMITLGNALLPVLTKIMSAVTPLIVAFTDWVAGGMKVNGTMQQIGSALQSVFLPIWQQLVALFQTQLLPLWFQLWAVIQQNLPTFQQVAIIIGGVVYSAFVIFIAVLRATIGALSGLLTGVVLVFQGIVQIVQGSLQFLQGIWNLWIDLLTLRFDKFGTDLQTACQGLLKMFQGFWTATEGVFVSAINGLIGLINGFIQGAVSALNVVITAMHGSAISVGQIPMLSAPAVAAGNMGNLFSPTASQAQGVTPKTQAQSNAGIQGILSQLQALQNQQNSTSLTAQANAAGTNSQLNTLNNSTVPQAANTIAGSGAAGHGKTAAQIQKAADTANAQRLRLAADYQKAQAASSSAGVQKLIAQSKAAQAAGNTATAAVYAQQAVSLANQQHAASQRAAHTALIAKHHAAVLKHHAQVLAAHAARVKQAAQHHAAVLAAAAARHKATLAAAAARHKAVLAAHAAHLAQRANHHKILVSTIQSTAQCASSTATALPTALGVALPNYAAGTGYVQSAPVTQQAPAGSGGTVHHHYNITVNTDSKDPKEHAKKVADEVKKQLATMLRGQSIAPRYTSGGIR